MNATNRKIDNKADPANDPAMAALRPTNRLMSLMDEIRMENPIGKPDRPHPPVTDLRTATSLETQREELQRAVATEQAATEQQAPAAAPQAPVTLQQLTEEPASQLVSKQTAEAKLELPQEAPKPAPAPEAAESLLPRDSAPDPVTQLSENLPVNDAALHADGPQKTRRLRGRPRVSEEKKRESSYTLSPHVADRIRDLAAHEQLRLKRTISASAIVERLIEIAEQHIQDNKVLAS